MKKNYVLVYYETATKFQRILLVSVVSSFRLNLSEIFRIVVFFVDLYIFFVK